MIGHMGQGTKPQSYLAFEILKENCRPVHTAVLIAQIQLPGLLCFVFKRKIIIALPSSIKELTAGHVCIQF